MTCIQNGRIVLLLAVLFFLTCAARAQTPLLDGCGDESCPIPTVDESNQPVYAIVSPVGYHAVEAIKQAPRLETLAQETKKNRKDAVAFGFSGWERRLEPPTFGATIRCSNPTELLPPS